MSRVSSENLMKLIGELNEVAKAAGMDLSYRLTGQIRVEDLGIDLNFNNSDCNGVCSTSCSGCSACSGCSGCSTTATVKGFDPGATVSNPNPLGELAAALQNPVVQSFLLEAARGAGRG